MDKQDQLEELLVDWGLERQRGNERSAEELCAKNPELAPELSLLIEDLKATDWLEADDPDSDDDFPHLPDFSTLSGHADETRLTKSKVSLETFRQRLIDSGLMDATRVAAFQSIHPSDNANALARQFVEEKKLTCFQATALLEGRDIPLVLDRYVLLGEIGAGGMGVVYKALHQQLDRVVALKILPKGAFDSPDKVKRFQREAKAAARLEHENIVTTHDASDDKGYHFLVMSLVSGSDLADLVRKQGPLSCAKAVDYIAQAARGLEHAHNIGIVHRDIKPGNLLLNKKGNVKILDMGLARIEDADHDKSVSNELTQAGMVMGTIAYLAPEQALDNRNADARSDIYALGCTLFYLLTGRPPYTENTTMKTILAHREGVIPSLCDERGGVPADLDAVFQRMVAKQPEDRFQSAGEVISALEKLNIKDQGGTRPLVATSQTHHDTATLLDTTREVISPTMTRSAGKPPIRRWIASGAFGLVILLAVLIIRVQTPLGTVVLQIDQPELIGAVVTIDGEQKITIKTGKGQQPIAVTPDERRHKLEVTVAGFKTFTKEFTFDTGNKQSITVRLEPLDAVAAKDEATAEPVTESSSHDNWALAFDGKDDYVAIPSFKINPNALTIDLYLTADRLWQTSPIFLVPSETNFFALNDYNGSVGFGVSLEEIGDLVSNTPISQFPLRQRVHLAGVWDGEQPRFYVDGRLALGKNQAKKHYRFPELPILLAANLQLKEHFSGVFDEARISDVARYDKNFIPAKRFEHDRNTLALYHFDEGSGKILNDSSGNGHHGKIVGARWVKVGD